MKKFLAPFCNWTAQRSQYFTVGSSLDKKLPGAFLLLSSLLLVLKVQVIDFCLLQSRDEKTRNSKFRQISPGRLSFKTENAWDSHALSSSILSSLDIPLIQTCLLSISILGESTLYMQCGPENSNKFNWIHLYSFFHIVFFFKGSLSFSNAYQHMNEHPKKCAQIQIAQKILSQLSHLLVNFQASQFTFLSFSFISSKWEMILDPQI